MKASNGASRISLTLPPWKFSSTTVSLSACTNKRMHRLVRRASGEREGRASGPGLPRGEAGDEVRGWEGVDKAGGEALQGGLGGALLARAKLSYSFMTCANRRTATFERKGHGGQ